MNELRIFQCKNQECKAEILIPSSILLQKSPHQARLTTGEFCTGIVCPTCKHAYGYKPEDFHPLLNDSPNPYDNPAGASWTAVNIECDDGNCETRVQLLTLVKPVLHTDEELYFSGLSLEAQGWRPHGMQCGKGHPISLPPKSTFLS